MVPLRHSFPPKYPKILLQSATTYCLLTETFHFDVHIFNSLVLELKLSTSQVTTYVTYTQHQIIPRREVHFPTMEYKPVLTLSNPIFLPTAYSQLLFVLGGKEVCGLLVIILQF
jgi:hypothetical protein